MIKNFKFFRGKEDDEIISQVEWNRRRDRLADAAREYNEEVERIRQNMINRISETNGEKKKDNIFIRFMKFTDLGPFNVPAIIVLLSIIIMGTLKLIDTLSK